MNHACAVRATGTDCWGASELIGDGTVDRVFVPTHVLTAAVFTELTAGFEHTCGRTTGGEVWCWGRLGSEFPCVPRLPRSPRAARGERTDVRALQEDVGYIGAWCFPP